MIQINSYAKKAAISFSWCAILFFSVFVLQKPNDAAMAVYDALLLCVRNVIPSLFPYMVISALFVSSGLASFVGRLFAKPFSKLFAMNGNCCAAVIIGLIAGFPVGAKTAVSLYKDGYCDKDEAQRLCTFCNNTGPAFVIGAIGAGFFGRPAVGAALYLTEVLAAFLTGFILSIGKQRNRPVQRCVICYRLDFPAAVKEAVSAVLLVCGFVVFFSVLMSILTELLLSAGLSSLLALASSLLEVTAGVSLAAEFTGIGGFIFAAFAIGWAGLCVHAQSASFMLPAKLSLIKYMGGKALQGILCALISVPIYVIFLKL
ncbi:MAG: hypothetical protein HFE78_05335 [Clostridiales bacterium]|nr:hypothetical protein [Clostridiales bacterium]